MRGGFRSPLGEQPRRRRSTTLPVRTSTRTAARRPAGRGAAACML